MKRKTFFLLYLLPIAVHSQFPKMGLMNESKSEAITRTRLREVIEEFNIEKWVFTDTLVIDDQSIPHSHPVLTLNTKPQSDMSLLAVFLHENIHWFLDIKEENTSLAMEELKIKFPNVPVGKRLGARSTESTYLHLIVNYLEYDAIKQVAGERAAWVVLQRKNYYRWIYEQVLKDFDYFEELVQRHQLKI